MGNKIKINRKALTKMVQVIVHPKGEKPEVTYLGGGRICIKPMEQSGISDITIAMPGSHRKTTHADLIIEKWNRAEVSRANR